MQDNKFKLGNKVFVTGIGKATIVNVLPDIEYGIVVKFDGSESLMTFLHNGKSNKFGEGVSLQLINNQTVLCNPNMDNVDTAIMNLESVINYLSEIDLQLAHDILKDKYKLIRHQYATRLVGDYNKIKAEDKNEKL